MRRRKQSERGLDAQLPTVETLVESRVVRDWLLSWCCHCGACGERESFLRLLLILSLNTQRAKLALDAVDGLYGQSLAAESSKRTTRAAARAAFLSLRRNTVRGHQGGALVVLPKDANAGCTRACMHRFERRAGGNGWDAILALYSSSSPSHVALYSPASPCSCVTRDSASLPLSSSSRRLSSRLTVVVA